MSPSTIRRVETVASGCLIGVAVGLRVGFWLYDLPRKTSRKLRDLQCREGVE